MSTTYVIYRTSASGGFSQRWISDANGWDTIRQGGGNTGSGGSPQTAGSWDNTLLRIKQGFFHFDTRSIFAGAYDVTLSARTTAATPGTSGGNNGTDLYRYDGAASIGAASFRTPTQLGALSLVGTMPHATAASTWYTSSTIAGYTVPAQEDFGFCAAHPSQLVSTPPLPTTSAWDMEVAFDTSLGREPYLTLTGGPTLNSQTFTNNGTFTVPAGVTSIQVEAVGGGGGGGTDSAQEPGGGGGAYARSFVAVSPSQQHSVTIGAGGGPNVDGGDSIFGSNLVVAKGGLKGLGATAGAGGAAASSTGDLKFSGGAGGAQQGGGGSRSGSGGGSGAGRSGAGNAGASGSGSTAGAGGVSSGELSGAGGIGAAPGGTAGSGAAYGGGGGGKGSGTSTSGSGVAGVVVVRWETPPVGGGGLKYWNGSAWVVKPMKRWNGSAWVAATLKRWNGSTWVTVP